MDFNAKNIKITPPAISKYFDGNCFPKLPVQKPHKDMINDVKPITTTDKTSGAEIKFKLAPATNASILVATPRLIRHLQPIQQISSFSSCKASKINFNPSTKNIPNTSHLLYGSIKSCI